MLSTGVEVGRAIIHGGPYLATTDSSITSVGRPRSAVRATRRVPEYAAGVFPRALRNDNPLGMRLVDGELTDRAPIDTRNSAELNEHDRLRRLRHLHGGYIGARFAPGGAGRPATIS